MSLLDGVYAGTPLNTTELPQATLDIVNKSRVNPLPWNGQFSPQLAQALLRKYGGRQTTVFDPFLGSGTVLLEAGLLGLPACGTEINPAAIKLAQTYQFINIPLSARQLYLSQVSTLLQNSFTQPLPLFQALDPDQWLPKPDKIKSSLLGLSRACEDRLLRQLLETLIVLFDFAQPELTPKRIFTAWHKIVKLVAELPFSSQPIKVSHADARQTPLPAASIDLVVTSPPYINVFNYHQQYRASAEALNWDLLKVARSEIGSNRKHRGNRFLTVIQYCLDMAQVFQELARICRPDARIIFVVGRESRVRGTPFLNGEIVAEVACKVSGFDLLLKQERVFTNRFGQSIREDILHFVPPSYQKKMPLVAARLIARDVLEAAASVASDLAQEDIKLALSQVEKVQPSPIWEAKGNPVAANDPSIALPTWR